MLLCMILYTFFLRKSINNITTNDIKKIMNIKLMIYKIIIYGFKVNYIKKYIDFFKKKCIQNHA